MKRLLLLAACLASLGAAAAVLGLGAGAARAVGEVNECPADWVLTTPPEPDAIPRLADRDGDGSVCELRDPFGLRGMDMFTDNAIGNPNIIPPGPCTSPFARVEIGNPGIYPVFRVLDLNGDGTLCGATRFDGRALIVILLDNPNVIPR